MRADLAPEPPTDADLPPLEALDADSDMSAFLSPRVSERLRQAALRKVFHTAKYNVVDGLDDYADDYTVFTPLGDTITADMRHRMEMEAERLKAQLAAEADAGAPGTPPAETAAAAAAPAPDTSEDTATASGDSEENEFDERSDDDPARGGRIA